MQNNSFFNGNNKSENNLRKRIHSFTPRLNVIKKEILPTVLIHFKAERQQGEWKIYQLRATVPLKNNFSMLELKKMYSLQCEELIFWSLYLIIIPYYWSMSSPWRIVGLSLSIFIRCHIQIGWE